MIGNLDLNYWDNSSRPVAAAKSNPIDAPIILAYIEQNGELSIFDIYSHFPQYRESALSDCVAKLIEERKLRFTQEYNLTAL